MAEYLTPANSNSSSSSGPTFNCMKLLALWLRQAAVINALAPSLPFVRNKFICYSKYAFKFIQIVCTFPNRIFQLIICSLIANIAVQLRATLFYLNVTINSEFISKIWVKSSEKQNKIQLLKSALFKLLYNTCICMFCKTSLNHNANMNHKQIIYKKKKMKNTVTRRITFIGWQFRMSHWIQFVSVCVRAQQEPVLFIGIWLAISQKGHTKMLETAQIK